MKQKENYSYSFKIRRVFLTAALARGFCEELVDEFRNVILAGCQLGIKCDAKTLKLRETQALNERKDLERHDGDETQATFDRLDRELREAERNIARYIEEHVQAAASEALEKELAQNKRQMNSMKLEISNLSRNLTIRGCGARRRSVLLRGGGELALVWWPQVRQGAVDREETSGHFGQQVCNDCYLWIRRVGSRNSKYQQYRGEGAHD